MGQLYLIRHGKTALNGTAATDRIRGWENVPLDAEGLAQATRLGQVFESKGLDELHSSDLGRAQDTADAIAATTGVTNQPAIEFRPWNLGEFQGQESADVAPLIRGYVMDSPEDPVPGGESFSDFEMRFLPAFEALLERARAGCTVGLVTHYRCVKLAEAWLANGQADQLSIKPEEFLKADLEPADVLCVYFDTVKGRWIAAPDDDTTAGEEGQMREKHILCEVGTLADGVTRQRIQVFPKPDEYVHPKSGPFSLTREHLDEFADAINASEVPVDRDHAFYKGLPAPAAGWLVPGSAVASDEGVSSDVEYTPTAAQQVRDKEYRFISPEFSFAHAEMDGRKVAEPTLHAVTLTNRPFFRSMLPIAAEDLDIGDEVLVAEAFGEQAADALMTFSSDVVREIVAAAATKVGSKPGMAAHTAGSKFADPGYQKDGRKRYALDNADEVKAAWRYISQAKNGAKYQPDQLSRVKARIKRAAKKLGITIGADSTAGGDMDLTVLAEAFGIAADASEEDVLEAAKRVAAENADLKKRVEAAPSADDMKKLLADAASGAKAATDLAEITKKTVIDGAVRVGKIAASETDYYGKLYDMDADGTAALLAEKPVVIAMKPTGSGDAVVYDAGGVPLARDGQSVTADLATVQVDGVATPVDEEGAKLLAATMSVLAQKGKASGFSEDEFIAATHEAAAIVGITL